MLRSKRIISSGQLRALQTNAFGWKTETAAGISSYFFLNRSLQPEDNALYLVVVGFETCISRRFVAF